VGSEITGQDRFDIHLDTGGGRLEAVWIGPAPDQAPTLIFLHEGLGCVDLWRDVPARLAGITGWGALVYSRLGYGRSDPCPLPRTVDFMHHEGLTVLPDVIRQTGIGNYVLVGHSDGGSIALIHAGGSPCPGLMGIITLAAHVFCEDLTRRSIEAARERYLNGDLKARLSLTTEKIPTAPSGAGAMSGFIPISGLGPSKPSCLPFMCRYWPSRGKPTPTDHRRRLMPSGQTSGVLQP
jgi:fermentation-respiration switch protein FrsA (DUF1100 family)